MKVANTLFALLFSFVAFSQDKQDPLAVAGEVTCECFSKVSEEGEETVEQQLKDCLSAGALAYQLAGISNAVESEKDTTETEEGETIITSLDSETFINYLSENCDNYPYETAGPNDELLKEVSEVSCECIAQISTALPLQEKNNRIQQCITEAIANKTVSGKLEFTVEGLRSFFEEVQKDLVENCDAVRIVTFASDEEKLNSYSYNEEAIDNYTKGQKAYKEGKLKEAVRYYKKAVSIDKEFVFAWDNLGRTYRELNKFDEAIAAYESSLMIDPLNRTALMNIAVAYNYKKDLDNAMKYYEILKKHYPEDPESPYGLALIYWQKGDLNASLTNAIQAFKLYDISKSPYKADAEKVINYLYGDFKKNNKEEDFKKICKENNVNLGF